MSENSKQYRTVFGIVQFDPREGEAAGKPIRNITIRNVGFKDQSVRVSATLWPSHAHCKVERGDVVLVEGSYSQGKGTDKDTGAPVVYHNLSVTRFKNFGPSDEGSRVETTVSAPDVDDVDDDDIPF